ncbi:MAG: polysaccharide pyruvyl transferase family protein [Clostridia bacterium]|nr:polysaccharide pyruvyl transferase family protein [Clostridia bacterium]
MSKKVGVITVHKNVNYGANLQAFASCRYLNKLGYDCSLIDYTLPEHEKSAHLFSWLKQSWDAERNKSLTRKIKLAIALAASASWKNKRLKAFDKFRKKYIKMTKFCKNAQDIARLGLDTVVCGSDQIWNPTITGGINPIFFGAIDGVQKRISYAASVGKDKFEAHDEVRVKKLVAELDYCSVREENTAQYIAKITGKPIETVCDPVFLLDLADYQAVASKRLIKRDYVLLYSVVHNDLLTAIAKDYADKHGLQLIEICTSKDKKATHKQIAKYGPSEFLSCFQYAKTVFTNSFHGTAFSLIFEKDFYIVDNKAGGSRIVNLLGKVGLLQRLITQKVEEDFSAIDYKASKQLLQEYVYSSKAFLEKALNADSEPLAGNACMSCGACKAVCKFDAIRLITGKEGFLMAVVDKQKCTDCGMCRKVCPALNPVQNHENEPTVYAFKAKDELRKNSASGGAFAALAIEVIRNDGVFYGAAQMDDFSVVHIRGNSTADLRKIQGTKYLPSDVTACYEQISEDLKQGKTVLFSGTPCQVDGIRRFAECKKLPLENLYFVDIICHGVPSPTFYKSYMEWLEKEYNSKIIEYKFRNKKISWRGSSCYAKLEDGKELCNEKKVCAFMNVYYSNHITREGCYICPYTSKERVSDLTISDCWGLEDMGVDFEDALGASMIMVNTEKGKHLLDVLEGERIEVSVEKAKQPQLSAPVSRPSTREEFWLKYEQKGVKPLLKKYGGIKRDSLKTVLYKLKKKILK